MNKKGVMFAPFLVVMVVLLSSYAIFVSIDSFDFTYKDHLSLITKMSTQADIGVWYWEKAAEKIAMKMLEENKECVNFEKNNLNKDCLDDNVDDYSDYFNSEMYKYQLTYSFKDKNCKNPVFQTYFVNKGDMSDSEYELELFKIRYLNSLDFFNYPDDIFCKQYNVYLDKEDIVGYSKIQFYLQGDEYDLDKKTDTLAYEDNHRKVAKLTYYPHFHLKINDLIDKLRIKLTNQGEKIPDKIVKEKEETKKEVTPQI